MIIVIFEVFPREGERDAYLDMAAEMRPLVDAIDGFISVERFESLSTPGKILSISTFRDEAALDEWRRLTRHRSAQRAGRERMFADYRIRVASVLRDYGMKEREGAPEDSRALHG
ncbi:antibiotic biosynthesis monooxygenase [Pikeienuella piscinae]|uniref:Antibiotic biosynthesis monooxygenase n=1 Tax=Pikeienuella piscinae TaxID=2748098 RepID=A0A7L5BY37_9RHOB|nr:antibiotic biosynthesis monooxygenase [Pikeienuella piscinae]QIE56361.1 antibiotic biosynthesis monooxygenase [Pikeienuella piscinae]